MNKIDFLADTNILIYLLEGKAETVVLNDYRLAISVINEMELLGKRNISTQELDVIKELLEALPILPFDASVQKKAIHYLQNYHIKLADAIIAATAAVHNLPLITADKGLRNIHELHVIEFVVE